MVVCSNNLLLCIYVLLRKVRSGPICGQVVRRAVCWLLQAGTVSDGEVPSEKLSSSVQSLDQASDSSSSCDQPRGRVGRWLVGFEGLLHDPLGLLVFAVSLTVSLRIRGSFLSLSLGPLFTLYDFVVFSTSGGCCLSSRRSGRRRQKATIAERALKTSVHRCATLPLLLVLASRADSCRFQTNERKQTAASKGSGSTLVWRKQQQRFLEKNYKSSGFAQDSFLPTYWLL